MRKRLYMLLLASATLVSAHAQLNGSGYYRVKNATTGRWMTLCDRHSDGINYQATTADCSALVTNSIWEDIASDPGSIFYLESQGGDSYNIHAQGTNVKQMIDLYLNVTKRGNHYVAWQELKGQRAFLGDKSSSKDQSWVVTTGSDNSWDINPINNTDNYLGVKPTIQVGDKHYAPFFASFPYTLGNGMKAYYINQIDENKGIAICKELTGTIPAETPVIIECASAETNQNQLTPVTDAAATPADNLQKGVYFCIGDRWSGKYNAVGFDASTMRTLGTNAEGKLAMTNATDHLPNVLLKEEDASGNHLSTLAIPANTCYLPVSEGTPAQLTLMTEEEYATGITTVSNAPTKKSYDVYTLSGNLLRKNAPSLTNLPKGIYIVNGKKVVI